MNYIGEQYVNHYPVTTDNPTKQLWMMVFLNILIRVL